MPPLFFLSPFLSGRPRIPVQTAPIAFDRQTTGVPHRTLPSPPTSTDRTCAAHAAQRPRRSPSSPPPSTAAGAQPPPVTRAPKCHASRGGAKYRFRHRRGSRSAREVSCRISPCEPALMRPTWTRNRRRAQGPGRRRQAPSARRRERLSHNVPPILCWMFLRYYKRQARAPPSAHCARDPQCVQDPLGPTTYLRSLLCTRSSAYDFTNITREEGGGTPSSPCAGSISAIP